MNFTRQTIPTVSAAQEEPKQETAKQATVNIRVDANCTMLCDGEYIETQFQANKITKMNLPLGQHLLEFFDMDYPDVIVEQEVDWQEEGKAYLVIIKGLQEKIEAARQADEEKKRDVATQKAQAEAERLAKEDAARRAIAEMERKAAEEAERKIREEEERRAMAEAEQKAIIDDEKQGAYKKNVEQHDYVDFGIEGMPLWATCNLGASSPEQRGDRYAWGETETKDKFKDSNYTKKGKYNKRDGKTQLDLEDDAARVQWGGKWQMPTAADFDLLSKRCKLERATVNGKNGLLVSHSGKSIFFPDLPVEFAYWTSSPLVGSEDEAISATIYKDIRLSGGLVMRYSGYFIRPIIRK